MTSSKIRTSPAKDAAGPFGDYAEQFRAHLESQNYSRCSIADYERCIRRLGRLIDENGIALQELTATLAAELVVKSGWRPMRPQYAAFIAKTFINYLAELGLAKLAPAPAEVNPARAILRRHYEDYLCRERGLSKISIHHCWHYADRFLAFRFGSEGDDLRKITPGDIIAFLQHLVRSRCQCEDTPRCTNRCPRSPDDEMSFPSVPSFTHTLCGDAGGERRARRGGSLSTQRLFRGYTW